MTTHSREYLVSYSPTFKFVANIANVYFTSANSDGYFAACSLDDNIYMCNIEASEIDDFSSNYLATAIHLPQRDDVLAYATFNRYFSQTKYDIQTSYAYIGTAKINTLTSDMGWTIRRISFDIDGNPTAEMTTETAAASWDNREQEIYY